MANDRPNWLDPDWELTDEQLLAMTAAPVTKPRREPMIFRLARENAEAIRNMGREEIAKEFGRYEAYESRRGTNPRRPRLTCGDLIYGAL